MCLVDGDMLTQPDRARAPPVPVVLVDDGPVVIQEVGLGIALHIIFLVEHLVPPAAGLTVGLHLSPDVAVVLEKLHPLHQHRVVAAQGVGRYPGLDGRAAPAVDDDALGYARLLIHPLAEEGAHRREEPGILLRQRLPVNARRPDVVLHAVSIRVILNTEEPDLVERKIIDFIGIIRIYALNRHVDVRLARQQPDIADEHIVDT